MPHLRRESMALKGFDTSGSSSRIAMLKSRRVEVSGSFEAINELYYQRGWTDGLPIVPPTEDRVRQMLEASSRDPEKVLGVFPPINGTATVEKVAINAVMAGCRPEYFAIVVASVEAVCQEQFNVGGVQSTTGGAAPVLIINGPLTSRLNVNSETGVFGHGYRANATIGRALRLVMRNIGGAIPGETDKSTFGHPGKYTMCIAENERISPWEPLHVESGYQPNTSTVTAVAVTGFHQISEMTVTSGREVLNTICGSLQGGGNVLHYIIGRETPLLLVLGPEHAQEIAEDGFTKSDVKSYVFEHAGMSVGSLRDRGYWGNRTWPDWVDAQDDEFMVPPVSRPENIIIVVAGGDGRHSAWLPSWSTSRAATVPVENNAQRA